MIFFRLRYNVNTVFLLYIETDIQVQLDLDPYLYNSLRYGWIPDHFEVDVFTISSILSC